ncbi:MAG TPA: phosphohistidine phosphatase SixA [Myxococcaceae bacterium]|nr:phosphohistidine phosphatase SixA [Myxococcaceae bacterium]
MDLLLVRHAIAEDRATFARTGKDDGLRPLTPQGRKKMERAAEGIRQIFWELDLLASSPLVRASQTAEILAEAYGGRDVATVKALAPGGGSPAVAEWLRSQRGKERVVLVGHEPDLGQLVGWFLTGDDTSLIELKKGAACLLALAGPPAPGKATLRWAMAPAQLRKLASSPDDEESA